MQTNINVAKFGGTSVADHSTITNCARIILSNPNTRVVVVSAAAGITNRLVSLANHALTAAEISRIVDEIKAIKYNILLKLSDVNTSKSKLDDLLTELKSLASHEEINFRDDLKDELLSMGERMSSLIVTAIINEAGGRAINFDVRKVLRTDSNYTCAAPQLDMIRSLCTALLKPEIKQSIVVTQGFVGASDDGKTTTLGRGGSDFTAALIAEGLDADTCEIWTDVNGVYTTDPRITTDAMRIPELSFEEAAEMATFGAKVLHPATMEPALRQNIKVFVGSSKDPASGGTWIVKDCAHEPEYRALTRRKDQVMVTLKTPKMMHAQGFLQRVFEIIAKHNLSVDLVTTSEISVSFTLDNPPDSLSQRINNRTIAELKEMCDVMVEKEYDLITVVGNNMHSKAGVSSKIFAAVADFNLRMICFGANPHNMSMLVSESDSTTIVKVLHAALFEQ